MDSSNNTPLHCACASQNLEVATVLVRHGAEFGRVALNADRKSPQDLARGECLRFLQVQSVPQLVPCRGALGSCGRG